MRRLVRIIATFPAVLLALAVSTMPALAAIKTVTLTVSGMTCAACLITVKTALTKVHGVEKAEVSFEQKKAVITYDDTKTNVDKLKEATKNAGFPSTEER